MNVESVLSSAQASIPDSRIGHARSPLATLLSSQAQKPTPNQHKQLVHAARELVSQTFFGQMLKQMRNDPFKSKLFDGGRGGEMFSAMYDQKLADRMARGVGNKLVMSIVRHIEKNARHHTEKTLVAPPKKSPDELKSAYKNSGDAASQKSNPYKNVRIHVAPGLRA